MEILHFLDIRYTFSSRPAQEEFIYEYENFNSNTEEVYSFVLTAD